MDRISALRNVEEALADYEAGDATLADLERRVQTVLRTYATEFGADEDLAAYRATGDPPADGLVVVADSPAAARERVAELVADAADDGEATADAESTAADAESTAADAESTAADAESTAADAESAAADDDPTTDLDFEVTPVDR